MPFALNRPKDLIEMPRFPGLRPTVAELMGIRLAERAAPFANGFVRHNDPTGEQQLFDRAGAQAETNVQPDNMSDHFRRKPVACIRMGRRSCVHVATMPHQPRAGQRGRLS